MVGNIDRVRIAIVQHADWLAVRRLARAGEPEPYFAMGYAVRAIEELVAGREHCIISLNAAPDQTTEGQGIYVNLPPPPSKWLPGSVVAWNWAGVMLQHLGAFKPTHLLLRTGGIPAYRLLRWANARGVQTLAIFANFFDQTRWKDRRLNRALAHQLNRPGVIRAGQPSLAGHGNHDPVWAASRKGRRVGLA